MGHHYCCKERKVKRGLWSPEEDEKLLRYITTYGHGCWRKVPEQAGLSQSLSLSQHKLVFMCQWFDCVCGFSQGYKGVARAAD